MTYDAVSDHPIVMSASMTNTPTMKGRRNNHSNSKEIEDAGSELSVRITVNDADAMVAVKDIITQLRSDGYTTPIIGDFHYNGHILLKQHPTKLNYLQNIELTLEMLVKVTKKMIISKP